MKKILFCFLILISVTTFGQKKFQNLKGSKPMKVEYLGKSPKLTAIKPIPNRTKANESDIYIVPNKLTKTGMLKQGPNLAPDPVIQKSTTQTSASRAGQVLQGFDGASNDDNANVNGINVTPPDTQGDVGPNHYIQMVNSVTTIFDKSGNILFGPVPNSIFFQDLDPRLAGTNDGDPIVLYDQFADRWIISQFAVSAGAPFAMLIAVSATSDPLGEYNQYAIDYGNDFPDYPKLGIWNDALYITTRDFLNGGAFQGFSIVAVNRADLIAGVETEAQRFEIDNPPFDGILPADADGTLPPPEGEPHYSLFLGSGNELNLISTSIDFENPANSTLEFGTVPVAPFSFFNTTVPQANGQSLDALPFFLMYRLQYMNFGTHASLLTNHSVQEVAGGPFGVRWYEFRDTGTAPWEVYQQGTFLPDDGLNRWMGSVAINADGDIALAYSVSSATLAPSIRFAGQTSSESGTGILNIPETSILEGTFFSSGPPTRWGDYSMMSIDPVDQDFWFTTEYIANNTGNFGWATFISEMTFGDAPTAICQDITVELDAAVGSISITPEQIDNGSIGPDGGEVTLSLDIDTFDCTNIGENIVTLTATSLDGISASCTAVVTVNVIDTEAPVAVCQDIFVELNSESVEITAEQVDGGSTDNCAIASLEVDQSVFTELGAFTVTLTVTDFAGLTDTCEATVTVAEGAAIVVDPLSLSAAVDVETVNPPIVTETFTVTNNGGVPLDFTTEVGITQNASGVIANALANLDRSIYGGGENTSSPGKLKAAETKTLASSTPTEILAGSIPVLDSLFLDSGIDFPGDFVGFGPGGPGLSAGVRFVVPEGGFTLNAVRNAYRTEDFGSADILLQVYAGGATPDLGTLLTEQLITDESADGTVPITVLNSPQQFAAGDVFWIVHNYPFGIDFPQGFDDTLPGNNSEDYVISSDGGVTFTNQAGFPFLTRALNVLGGFISLSPSSGTVNPGEDLVVEVTFDATDLGNGVFETPILVSSNDVNNSEVTVETTFTVSGVPVPEIQVTPESLEASVDVQVDDPPVRTETFTVSNSGTGVLEFMTALGVTSTSFTDVNVIDVSSLNMSDYGVGNTIGATAKKAGSVDIDAIKKNLAESVNTTTFTDSIFYDSGSGIADDFVGFGDTTTAVSSAIRFDTDRNFTLTAVRNFYRTESLADPVIILEIYRGGTTPAEGELLLSQTTSEASAEGIFLLEPLNEALSFEAGETFWVVHKYPAGIPFSQGIDTAGTPRPGANLFSSNGGATWDIVPDDFIILCRALSGNASGPYITLEPTSGTVSSGESVDVTVTFNGEGLANGTYETDILIDSNDPVTPQVTVATTFQVSGQTSEIAVSDEFLLYNNVFLGNDLEKIVTITNNGLSQLNISSISSDNPDFTVSDSTAVVDVGQSLELGITFTPSSLGSINGIITVESDASNESTVEIVVNGIGVDPPIAVFDPSEVSATVNARESVDVDIALRNDGNSPLIYSFPDFAVAKLLSNENTKRNNTSFIEFGKSAEMTKESTDNRVGHKVMLGAGSDNGFGYTWIDSDEDGGPVYNFTDIAGSGVEITTDLGGDGTTSVDLTFPFEFYGNTYNSLFVNANGFVSFQEPSGVTFINGQIPADDGKNNIIAGLWDDLEPQIGEGSVHYESFADRFIVQWTNTTRFFRPAEQTVTFQIVLYADGNIDIFYEDVNTALFLDEATVGIENADATDGALVAFNTDYIKDQLAVRFIKPAMPLTSFITDVSRLSGVVPAGGSRTLTVTLDAADLVDGTYFDELTVSSNSPDKSNSTALFELTVIGLPEIQVAPQNIEFEPLFIGLESEATFLIENIGTKTLAISSFSNSNSDYTVALEVPDSLAPGASLEGTITFKPSTEGTITDEIIIVNNDAFGNENISILVSGTGVIPPVIGVDPESIDLALYEGDSMTKNITISNTGGSVLNYSIVPPALVASDSLLQNTVRGYERLEFSEITSKEQPDTRKGPAFLNASGGPGTFGYTWVDNNSGGPAYNFMDISATGTQANVGADGDETVPLPFTFNFFGEDQNEVIIAANGFLTFEPITALFGAFLNRQIPDPANPNNFIAPLWDDLEPQNGTGVFYQGTEDYFIVQYEEVPGFGIGAPPAPVTFQIILFPDGSFKMQYKNVDSTISTSSTVGIEGPQGTSGLQVIFNAEYLTNELAITFTPPVRGSVEPGESVEIPLEFSTDGLEAGTTYMGDIKISSNDPVTPEVIVPVTLEVLALPEVLSFSLVNAVTDEIVGVIESGDVVDINEYGSNNFNIIANLSEVEAGSVVFDYNFQNRFKVRNRAPFTLAGERNGNFRSIAFPLGNNTLTATPFTKKRGKGKEGFPLSIDFTVVDSSLPEIVSFTLVDADTDQTIGEIRDGDILNLSQFAANSFNIIANRGVQRAGSVVFDFNGISDYRTQNEAPYALGGRRGLDFNSLSFPLGRNIVTATPYTGTNGRGDEGIAATLNFEVVDGTNDVLVLSNASTIDGSLSADFNLKVNNPVQDIAYFTIGNKSGNELKLTLMNLMGQVIFYPKDISIDNLGKGTINMSNLANGAYILIVTDSKETVISKQKIIKL